MDESFSSDEQPRVIFGPYTNEDRFKDVCWEMMHYNFNCPDKDPLYLRYQEIQEEPLTTS